MGKNRKLTKEDLSNLLKLLINTNGKSLNDLTEEELSSLYDRDIKPLLENKEQKDEFDYSSLFPSQKTGELDDEEKKWAKSHDRINFSTQYILTMEQLNELNSKMTEVSKKWEKTIRDKLNKNIEFDSTKIIRGSNYNDIAHIIKYCYTENYIKALEINNESFIICCDPILVNRVLMYSSDAYNATNLKKEIAAEFVINPILETFNKEALNKDFTKQISYKNLYYHKSSYNWIYMEKKVSFDGEVGSILIAAPENIWQLYINAKSLPTDNEECVCFNENTSYAVIASTSIRDEDVANIKVGDKIYFENNDYTSSISIYKNKEVIREELTLSAFGYNTYGVMKEVSLWGPEKREIGNDNLLVIVGEKERSEEEINRFREKKYVSLETDLSHKLTLLYNHKPIAKGIFAEKNGQCCFTVDSIITNKEGE